MRKPSRRAVLKTAGAAFVVPAAIGAARSAAAQTPRRRARDEGPDTPKISLEAGASLTATPSSDSAAAARRIRQLGVEHVLGGGGPIPWQESRLQALRDNLKANGITLGNLMISGVPERHLQPPGPRRRHREGHPIDSRSRTRRPAGRRIQLVRASRDGGLFRRARPRRRRHDRLRLRAHEGSAASAAGRRAHGSTTMWANITYFLKAVMPEAEKAGVRMALHPNDPPAPAQPRLRADHGIDRGLEEAHQHRQQPVERHHVRLRRHARDGRRSDRGLPVLRITRPHQPRALPQRHRPEAVRAVHRSLHRRRRQRHVRGDEGAGAAEVHAADLSRASACARLRPRAATSARSTRAAAATPDSRTTSATRARCCRRR